MKSKLLLFLSFSLFLTQCKKENPCQTPTFSVAAGGNGAFISAGYSHDFYQVEYGPNGFSKGSGMLSNSLDISIDQTGAYDFYLRGNCGGTAWSDWSEVSSIYLDIEENNCAKPVDLYTQSWGCYLELDWSSADIMNPNSLFQVEYGPTGFPLGSGTQVTLSNSYYDDASLTKNQIYDFYVRANCGGSVWSNWSAVNTFTVDRNYNLCLVPKNVSAFRNGAIIEFYFESDGDCTFEYTLVKSTETVLDGIISTGEDQLTFEGAYTGINSFTDYVFYVRTRCKNGNYSAWKSVAIN